MISSESATGILWRNSVPGFHNRRSLLCRGERRTCRKLPEKSRSWASVWRKRGTLLRSGSVWLENKVPSPRKKSVMKGRSDVVSGDKGAVVEADEVDAVHTARTR